MLRYHGENPVAQGDQQELMTFDALRLYCDRSIDQI
jgi:hypothetical protein